MASSPPSSPHPNRSFPFVSFGSTLFTLAVAALAYLGMPEWAKAAYALGWLSLLPLGLAFFAWEWGSRHGEKANDENHEFCRKMRRLRTVSAIVAVVAMVAAVFLGVSGYRSTQAPSTYGYLALDCKSGDIGRPDYGYVLYQHPEALQPPHFINVSPIYDQRASAMSYMTCTLHNDGTIPAYNVVLTFAFKIARAEKVEHYSAYDVMYDQIVVPRIAQGHFATIWFLDDLPGEDCFLAPTPQCSMGMPGDPTHQVDCKLPRQGPMVPPNLLQFGSVLSHFRSKTDCAGWTPPLKADQTNCLARKPGH